MRIAITVLLAHLLCSGCGLIMIGDPVREQDLSTEDDAEENLKAIRAMLKDRATHHPEERPAGTSSQPVPSDGVPAPVQPSGAPRQVPSPTSSAGQTDVLAKLPWTPSAPGRPALHDRSVPAYTIPAPVGPDYSGSVRCAPDGMGGQRCLGR